MSRVTGSADQQQPVKIGLPRKPARSPFVSAFGPVDRTTQSISGKSWAGPLPFYVAKVPAARSSITKQTISFILFGKKIPLLSLFGNRSAKLTVHAQRFLRTTSPHSCALFKDG